MTIKNQNKLSGFFQYHNILGYKNNYKINTVTVVYFSTSEKSSFNTSNEIFTMDCNDVPYFFIDVLNEFQVKGAMQQ